MDADTLKKYTDALLAAADWALADERTPWQNAVALARANTVDYPMTALQEAKETLRTELPAVFTQWLQEDNSRTGDAGLPLFDTSLPPEELWQNLYKRLDGIFAEGDDPLGSFIVYVYSAITGHGPLVLTPEYNGWGLADK